MSTFDPSVPLFHNNRPPVGWVDLVTGLTYRPYGVWRQGDLTVWGDATTGFRLPGVPSMAPFASLDHPQDLHSALRWLREHHPDSYAEVFPYGDPFGDESSEPPTGDTLSKPKPLDIDWTPADLDSPPEGTGWRVIAGEILRAAGADANTYGGSFCPGGWVLTPDPGLWRPYGGAARHSPTPTAALRALAACPEVTAISDNARRRILAWLDGDAEPNGEPECEPDPKPLATRWTPAHLDCPPYRMLWWEVLASVLVSAGLDAGGGNVRCAGGFTTNHRYPAWRPWGQTEWRTEKSGTACLRAILDCPLVTAIPDKTRARLLAWLDSETLQSEISPVTAQEVYGSYDMVAKVIEERDRLRTESDAAAKFLGSRLGNHDGSPVEQLVLECAHLAAKVSYRQRALDAATAELQELREVNAAMKAEREAERSKWAQLAEMEAELSRLSCALRKVLHPEI